MAPFRGRGRIGGGARPDQGDRREKKDVFFPMEIGAFVRDVLHFSTRRIGAYTLLMLAGWVEGGRLMRSDDELRTITRLSPEDWAVDRPVLAEKYRIDPDGAWVHEGMQRRMRLLGIPVAAGGAAPAAQDVAGPVSVGQAPVGDAVRKARQEAARLSWVSRRGGESDAKSDANPVRGNANGHAKPDANLHGGDANGDANLHANLNLNPKSSTNQPTSLDLAREAEERGSGGLENAGSGGDQRVDAAVLAQALAHRLAAAMGRPEWSGDAKLLVCIKEWCALGLTDEAICSEVDAQTDAKRDANPAWVPNSPSYYTPGLKRLAAEGEGEAVAAAADPWAQRVESYRRTGFWLMDWEGKPDSAAPNPAIPEAVLTKHGFGKGA